MSPHWLSVVVLVHLCGIVEESLDKNGDETATVTAELAGGFLLDKNVLADLEIDKGNI